MLIDEITSAIDNLKQKTQEQDDACKKWQESQDALRKACKDMDNLVQKIKKETMFANVIEVEGQLFLIKTNGRNDSIEPLKVYKFTTSFSLPTDSSDKK